jgi:diguanylate cyclase (GGDEF)-like protein
VRARGVPVLDDGEVLQWIGVIDDITDQVNAADALRRAALEDPLTGLPNRAHFLDRVTAVLEHRAHAPAAVMYLDIDGFKAINDAFGHAGGDRLLRLVAERLRAAVRPSDVVCRLSGDEFAVLCDGLATHDEGLAIAGRLADALAVPIGELGGRVSASIGLAFAGPQDRSGEALLRDADAAMYQAKERGGGVEVFDERLRDRLRRRRTVEDELRAGLTRGGLQLHYQPVVAFDLEWPPTAEALLRWRAKDGTTLPALEVVSVAEQTGLIMPIGAEVLAQACRDAAAWNADGGGPLAVGVNVSAQQLARPVELVEQVVAALEGSGLSPSLLRLEITESMLVENHERSGEVLARLRGMGVRIALDDFGVGYSSLSYLHRMSVDAVKIDRSFVSGLPGDAASARIVEAVVGIARAFGMRVVAEGIETEEQLAAVKAAGCHGVQGFGLARPVPEDELVAAVEGVVRRVSS